MCATVQCSPEQNPCKAISYVFFVIQFMRMTLDLFMDTSIVPAWQHYTIASIELAIGALLVVHQLIRLVHLLRGPSLWCCRRRLHGAIKPTLLLLLSFLLQLSLLIIGGYSYCTQNITSSAAAIDDWKGWTMFGVSLAWGFVNPMTYSAVVVASNAAADMIEMRKQERERHKDIGRAVDERMSRQLSWMGAFRSVFWQHFTRTPLLYGTATLAAIGGAIMGTFKGAIINELTKAVTEGTASEGLVQKLASTLILVWFSSNLLRFTFDVLAAKIVSKLEIWMRRTIFDKAIQVRNDRTGLTALSPAEYQARYASDIAGVVSLYGALLQGVVVNVLLITTNFIFLATLDWKIATIVFGCLVVGVNTGPTDLAGNAARNVQIDITVGLEILEGTDGHDDSNPNSRISRKERHNIEVLLPMQPHVFQKSLYSSMTETLNSLFSSFLEVMVVISMSWQVYHGELDSSEFLGIFVVFKQLQKPVNKMSGIIKKAVSKTAHLERVNGVVFEDSTIGSRIGDDDEEEQCSTDSDIVSATIVRHRRQSMLVGDIIMKRSGDEHDARPLMSRHKSLTISHLGGGDETLSLATTAKEAPIV